MAACRRWLSRFPKHRQAAVLKVAQSCTVHNTLCSLPKIEVALA